MRWITNPLLVVEHLTMRFGGLVAVNDLSFQVGRGDITALIGPNGAGKTTVFNCVTGFYKPTEGRLALAREGVAAAADVEALTRSPARHALSASGELYLLERMAGNEIAWRAKVARTFQNIRLFQGMTVLENLMVAQHNMLMMASGFTVLGMFGAPSYRASEAAAVERATYWLDKIGLFDRADDPAGELPYGAQRRLEIARAMCTDPILLCLDEPAAGLNPREVSRSEPSLECDPRPARDVDSAHRARHVGGHADFRPRRRARLRHQDRRRHAGRRAQRSQSDRRLSGRRGRGRTGGRRSGDRLMSQASVTPRAAPLAPTAGSALLTVRGVETFYGKIQALKGVDIDVNQGEIVTLIGANGAGKSTTMMTICGNPRARRGSIVFDGRDITRLSTHEIARLSIAQSPEGRRIFPRMTVFENLQMGASIDGFAHFSEDVERMFALFPRLKERAPQRGGTLSGGEQQMLAIARALMSRPRLLLLDEPSLGLAPLIVKQIFNVIADLNKTQGLTVFLVEQNAFHALKLAHRGYVMVNGVITMQGTGAELLARPEVRAAYLEGGH